MIRWNDSMKAHDMEKEKILFNGEKILLNVEHRLEENTNITGWFISICTTDETGEVDWGFCSGWCPSYPAAKASIMAHEAYKRYPFFD